MSYRPLAYAGRAVTSSSVKDQYLGLRSLRNLDQPQAVLHVRHWFQPVHHFLHLRGIEPPGGRPERVLSVIQVLLKDSSSVPRPYTHTHEKTNTLYLHSFMRAIIPIGGEALRGSHSTLKAMATSINSQKRVRSLKKT